VVVFKEEPAVDVMFENMVIVRKTVGEKVKDELAVKLGNFQSNPLMLYGPSSNHQVPDLGPSRPTHIQGLNGRTHQPVTPRQIPDRSLTATLPFSCLSGQSDLAPLSSQLDLTELSSNQV